MPDESWFEVPILGGLVALADEVDRELIERHRWYQCQNGRACYAITRIKLDTGRWTTRSMHRLITDYPITDHHNGDGLDNRRVNLRDASTSQNGANRRANLRGTSKYRGVSWETRVGLWQVSICREGKQSGVGRFDDEIDAALAYDAAARVLYGEFAALNFPGAGERSALD